MKNKKGFTLAEVLITLGIIGVVAAITLPTMMQDGRKQQLGVKLAKFANNIESIMRPIGTESSDGFSGDDLIAILNDELLFNSGSASAASKATLRDGTEILLVTGNHTYGAEFSSSYGPVTSALAIEFFPNVFLYSPGFTFQPVLPAGFLGKCYFSSISGILFLFLYITC